MSRHNIELKDIPNCISLLLLDIATKKKRRFLEIKDLSGNCGVALKDHLQISTIGHGSSAEDKAVINK